MANDPNIPDPNTPPPGEPTGPGADPSAAAPDAAPNPAELESAAPAAGEPACQTAEPVASASAPGPSPVEPIPAEPAPAAISPEELEAALRTMQAADELHSATASADALTAAAEGSAPPMSDVEAAMAAMLDAEAQLGPSAQVASPGGAAPPDAPATQPFHLPDFAADAAGEVFGDLSLLDDVELDVKIELGRTEMYIEDVLRLGVGSVIELDRLAGDPVDIYVNERLVARGEVLVLNDNFCVRINDIVSPVPEVEAHP